jgi:hypothetical protein
MKKLLFVAACIALVGLAPCAFAAQIAVHGDLDHRFQLYNDQQTFFCNDASSSEPDCELNGTTDQYAEFKYRLWTEVATDDNAVKGVFAIEVGAVRFGKKSTTLTVKDGTGTEIGTTTTNAGGAFSGDGVNIETRWAYTDFMLGNGRMKVGLQPWNVNPYIWNETATAIQYAASAGIIDYTLGWARGKEYFNNDKDDAFNEDVDALLGRVNFGIGEGSKAGVFVLYQMSNPSASTPASTGTITSQGWEVKNFGDVDMSIWTLGVDGKLATAGPLFINWDLMYQNGKIEDATFTDSITSTTSGAFTDFDLSAYFAHVDVGVKLGKATLTYTAWYASGDDKADDDDFDAFVATDIDRMDSIIFQEAGYTSDDYFTERDYIFDKGMFVNKVAVDFQATDKTKVGAAVLYLQTAEDITYDDDSTPAVERSSTDLGIELDAYVSYQMYKNLTLALNAGYLFAGDALDVAETTTNGSSDENIFRSTARIQYKF